jgi:hypothetical protein
VLLVANGKSPNGSKKITSIPEMKKKDELPKKLLDDPKILTAKINH